MIKIGKPVVHVALRELWNKYQLPMETLFEGEWGYLDDEPNWYPSEKYRVRVPLDSEGNDLHVGRYEDCEITKIEWDEEGRLRIISDQCLSLVDLWNKPLVPCACNKYINIFTDGEFRYYSHDSDTWTLDNVFGLSGLLGFSQTDGGEIVDSPINAKYVVIK